MSAPVGVSGRLPRLTFLPPLCHLQRLLRLIKIYCYCTDKPLSRAPVRARGVNFAFFLTLKRNPPPPSTTGLKIQIDVCNCLFVRACVGVWVSHYFYVIFHVPAGLIRATCARIFSINNWWWYRQQNEGEGGRKGMQIFLADSHVGFANAQFWAHTHNFKQGGGGRNIELPNRARSAVRGRTRG